MLLGDMSKSCVFSCSLLYGVLIVILTSSLFGVFSCGLLVKEATTTSGKVSQALQKKTKKKQKEKRKRDTKTKFQYTHVLSLLFTLLIYRGGRECVILCNIDLDAGQFSILLCV